MGALTKHKVEPYLRGPIKLWWLHKAKDASAPALYVGLALWHYRSLTNTLEFSVTIRKLCQAMDLSRQQTIRGLKDLENNGLITLVRDKGKQSRIKIIDTNTQVTD